MLGLGDRNSQATRQGHTRLDRLCDLRLPPSGGLRINAVAL